MSYNDEEFRSGQESRQEQFSETTMRVGIRDILPMEHRALKARAGGGAPQSMAVTGVMFDDGRGNTFLVDHEATLMAMLVAPMASGKSCVDGPIEAIMDDIRKRDAMNMWFHRTRGNVQRISNQVSRARSFHIGCPSLIGLRP